MILFFTFQPHSGAVNPFSDASLLYKGTMIDPGYSGSAFKMGAC